MLASGEQCDFMPPGETINNNINTLPTTYAAIRLVGSMAHATGHRHEVQEIFADLAD